MILLRCCRLAGETLAMSRVFSLRIVVFDPFAYRTSSCQHEGGRELWLAFQLGSTRYLVHSTRVPSMQCYAVCSSTRSEKAKQAYEDGPDGNCCTFVARIFGWCVGCTLA